MSILSTCIVIIPPYFDGIRLKQSEIHVFEPFLKCVFVTRDTLFWRKIAFYLYLIIICAIKNINGCCDAIVHVKRIILIYKTYILCRN